MARIFINIKRYLISVQFLLCDDLPLDAHRLVVSSQQALHLNQDVGYERNTNQDKLRVSKRLSLQNPAVEHRRAFLFYYCGSITRRTSSFLFFL
jgi:hypothetical protein